ncbi:uncharacterized protein V6R79_006904 [Siganus canaliculatus]
MAAVQKTRWNKSGTAVEQLVVLFKLPFLQILKVRVNKSNNNWRTFEIYNFPAIPHYLIPIENTASRFNERKTAS